ncbi:MAG TPA: hypothetical protein VHX37_03605 [Acidobacteriaceae bacterium]|nr:hypothetical protein [Acidobacteriaceae bacterium]
MEDQVEQQQSAQSSAQAGSRKEDGVAKTTRALERQALELQRERILDERTSSPIRRKALEAALNEIEAKLAAL